MDVPILRHNPHRRRTQAVAAMISIIIGLPRARRLWKVASSALVLQCSPKMISVALRKPIAIVRYAAAVVLSSQVLLVSLFLSAVLATISSAVADRVSRL
ncbi:hypothetical protein D3C80_1852600 [compost metagenome]